MVIIRNKDILKGLIELIVESERNYIFLNKDDFIEILYKLMKTIKIEYYRQNGEAIYIPDFDFYIYLEEDKNENQKS